MRKRRTRREPDRTLTRCLLAIGIACALCIIVLVASRIQSHKDEHIITHCDELLYSGGR